MQTLKTPNVYRNEKDLSEVTVGAGTSTGALVMSARQGVVNQRVAIANDKQLIDTFGIPIPAGIDVGIYAGLEFLKESDSLYVVRATSGTEKYATISVTATNVTVSNGAGVTAAASTGTEENSPTKISDLNGALSTARLLIASKGPGSYGNEFGVTVVTSGSDISLIDWNEKYEVAVSGSVYKVSVFVKNTDGSFPTVAEEVFYGSNTYQKDSSGKQLFIKDVINGKSQYIYVDCIENTVPAQILSSTSGAIALAGGADSSSTFTVPEAKQTLAWNLFKDRTKVSVNILIDTLRTPTTTPAPASIVAQRLDSVACVQIGEVTDNYTALMTETYPTATTPSYVSVYAGWDKIYDSFNDREVYIPKCVFGAAVMARTDRIGKTWDAPAGTNRGILPSIGQNFVFSDTEIGNLYDKNINTSRQMRGIGNVLWGQKTAQKKKSALDRINVRRLLLYIENSVEPALQSFLFEPNTEKTRLRVYDIVDSFMKGVKAAEGVIKYEVVVDTTNNTSLTIDNNELVVDIYVQPTKTIEYIRMNIVITKTGVSFQEIR